MYAAVACAYTTHYVSGLVSKKPLLVLGTTQGHVILCYGSKSRSTLKSESPSLALYVQVTHPPHNLASNFDLWPVSRVCYTSFPWLGPIPGLPRQESNLTVSTMANTDAAKAAKTGSGDDDDDVREPKEKPTLPAQAPAPKPSRAHLTVDTTEPRAEVIKGRRRFGRQVERNHKYAAQRERLVYLFPLVRGFGWHYVKSNMLTEPEEPGVVVKKGAEPDAGEAGLSFPSFPHGGGLIYSEERRRLSCSGLLGALSALPDAEKHGWFDDNEKGLAANMAKGADGVTDANLDSEVAHSADGNWKGMNQPQTPKGQGSTTLAKGSDPIALETVERKDVLDASGPDLTRTTQVAFDIDSATVGTEDWDVPEGVGTPPVAQIPEKEPNLGVTAGRGMSGWDEWACSLVKTLYPAERMV
ncbi:hypothetical protein EDB92DRAFT_2103960 [Lactarius akahatsu]|uniref:Uncharacterized protein n=1 Tax=Lactarius akahatsu TaxID=416441 RepID=A0AAD4LG41_9AGAM|nr:hypothetical protein EDB92DRAFT_2103960 [Lactarius akahatsu]